MSTFAFNPLEGVFDIERNGGNTPVFAGNYTQVNFSMSPYYATPLDYYLSVDSTDGPVQIFLPDAPKNKREFIIKDRTGAGETNFITVSPATIATTIDFQLQTLILDAFEALEVLYYNNNYETI